MSSADREPLDEPEVFITVGPGADGDGPGRPPAGSGHGDRPGRMRWVALGIGLAVLIAIIGVQHYLGGGDDAKPSPTSGPTVAPPTSVSSSAATASPTSASESPPSAAATSGSPGPLSSSSVTPTVPSTTTVAADPLPGSAGWSLVGFRSSDSGLPGVVQYQPATGRLTTTPISPLMSSGPMSFAATATVAIIRPVDNVDGYLAPASGPAAVLTGLLARSAVVIPGPDAAHVWALVDQGSSQQLVLVDAQGHKAGPALTLPATLALGGAGSLWPDGAGYVLAGGLGGVYDVRPGGTRLVTHGAVLAAGPAAFVVYDCDAAARCSVETIDRASGKRVPVPRFRPAAFGVIQGVGSPDGRYAAVVGDGPDGTAISLLNVTTGAQVPVHARFTGLNPNTMASIAVFTPDGKYLLVAGTDGVVPVDVATGTALAPLPVPPLKAIAIRPAA